MAWRIAPDLRKMGQYPTPYRVWLSEIMLQQTTVAAVSAYFHRFTTKWPQLADLAGAEDADVMAAWAGLGYYARARNLLKTARIVQSEHNGVFPKDYDGLLALPGIGPYTAGAICTICYDARVAVLDGNIERVLARVFAIETPLPQAKVTLRERSLTLTPKLRSGDYVQGLMDLGATVCTPTNPRCEECPWQANCQGRKLGIAETLPRKAIKPPKPTRRGAVYVAIRFDGAVLLERRAGRGLLGGMLGWVGSDWVQSSLGDVPKHTPPCLGDVPVDWVFLVQPVRHTFTHFHLDLDVYVGHVGLEATAPADTFFMEAAEFDDSALPSVMRKVWQLVVSD